MKITERTLAEAWQRTAAGHDLLHGAALPPVARSDDELEELADHSEEVVDGGLCLVVDEDGTVRVHHGPYRQVFATRDLGQVLYLIAEDAVLRRAGGPAEAAGALERIDPVWGRRFQGGGLDDPGTVGACGRDPLEGLAWSRTRPSPSSARRPANPSTPSGWPCCTGPIPPRSRQARA
jgi:hypothetical protein